MKSSPLHHDVVCYGEILWDILPDKALPGGAPMNVAYHLKKLGVKPALITKVGRDAHGEKLIDLLSKSGITTDYLQIDEQQQTGLVYAHLKEHNEMVYDIVKPSAWDFIQWEEPFADVVKEAQYFVYGSLTSRSEVSKHTLFQLLEVANTKVLDINLRPPHFNQSLVEQLLEKTDLLKMNEAELNLISGWYSGAGQEEERMKLLQDRFHIETVIVTMGGDGAMLLDEGVIYKNGGYKVLVADTIGSGDAFLAAFISKKIKGIPVEEALDFACGAGAFVASQTGACPQYDPLQIQDIINNQAQQQTLSPF